MKLSYLPYLIFSFLLLSGCDDENLRLPIVGDTLLIDTNAVEAITEVNPVKIFNHWNDERNGISPHYDLDGDGTDDLSLYFFDYPFRTTRQYDIKVTSLSPDLTFYTVLEPDTIVRYTIPDPMFTTTTSTNLGIHNIPDSATGVEYRYLDRLLVKKFNTGDLVSTDFSDDFLVGDQTELYHRFNSYNPTPLGSFNERIEYGGFSLNETSFVVFHWHHPEGERIGWLQLYPKDGREAGLELRRYAIFGVE